MTFQPPQRPDQWTHIHDFNENENKNIMCVQNGYFGVEDCLYINVYTPSKLIRIVQCRFESITRKLSDINTNGSLPVVIAIHAGTFLTGSAQDYGPDFLLNEGDVVVVGNFSKDVGAVHSEIITTLPGHFQLSFGSAWILVTRNSRIFWKYGPKRPTDGYQMDQREHLQLWRRQKQNHLAWHYRRYYKIN